jgi:hypothetical protein
MRNPHNAAADVLVTMSLDDVLYEITTVDPNNDQRWFVRLVLKPGAQSHPLADAVFVVQITNASGVVVYESDQTPSTSATRSFCDRMVRSLCQSDDDW